MSERNTRHIPIEEVERAHAEDLALQCGEDPEHWPCVQDDPEFKKGIEKSDRREGVLRELSEVINAGADPEYFLQALEGYFQVKE